MVRQLGKSKMIVVIMAFTLILNTLTPMTVIFAEDTPTNFNQDGIKDAELIEEDVEEDKKLNYRGEIKSVSEGEKENIIIFDLSDQYKTEDLFIGFEHRFYLDSEKDVTILNKDDQQIDLTDGYTDYIKEANTPYKIKVKKDEEVVEYKIIVKTADYIAEPELEAVEEVKDETFNYGTTKKEIKEKLPKELTLKLNDNSTKKVTVEWDSTNFIANQSGEFKFQGNYELPEEIIGDLLPVELKVIILAETAELEKLINTAKEKEAKDYTEASFKALKLAIKNAEEVLEINDENQIAEAHTELQTAMNGLVIDNENYEFNIETGTITKYLGKQEDIVIPEEINGVKVKVIGELAFGERNLAGKKINKITIPNTVEKIGERAFYRAHLTEVILSNNLTEIGIEAFKHNEIKNLVIPESVSTIEKGTFESNKLSEVRLPSGLVTIKENAFKNNQLEGVVLPAELKEIGTGSFASNKINTLDIPSKLKEIKGFSDNNLTEITLPNTVERIGKAAFASNNFDSIELPDSITHIGELAFSDMKLKSVNFGNSIQEIREKAFYKNKLSGVNLPKSIEQIKTKAFTENEFVADSVKINKKQSEVSIASDSFKSGILVFLKDVEENLGFEEFDIILKDNKNFIAKGIENKTEIHFNEKLDSETQKMIKNNKTSFYIKTDSKTTLLIDNQVQYGNEVYFKVDTTKNNTFTLEKHNVKKDYKVNLEGLFINKTTLKNQLKTAKELIEESLLTDDSEAAIVNVSQEAQSIYDSKTSTQDEIDQITTKLANTLEEKEFILEVNRTGEIIKYNGTKSEIIIPSYWKGIKITQINANAFEKSNLKRIVIPETIEVIEESAFANNDLEEIKFEEDQLTLIMQKYDYLGLQQSPGLTIKVGAFKNNNLTKVYLPYQVKELENEAFAENNFELFSVKIDNYKSQVTLGENVFDNISPTFLRTHMNEVNKAYLKELLDQDKFVKASDYTTESYDKYRVIYDKAIIILEKNSTKEEVTQIIEDLFKAKQSLESNTEYSKSDLKKLVALIRGIDLRDFKVESEELWSLIENIEKSIDDLSPEDIKVFYQELNDYYKKFVTPEELFDYEILNDHEAVITEYRGNSSTLIIPTEIAGRKVTQIAVNAFNGKKFNKVVIPETVYQIGSQAFANNSIETVQLPKSLKQLGTEAFKNNKLEKVAIPGRLKVIANQTFAKNNGLKEVHLGEGVKEVNYLAFAQSRIDTINFPSSLEKIGELAFAKNQITEVHLSENVVEIGASAFQENKIEAGKATINNVKANVQEGKNTFAKNGLASNQEIELIYNGIEETTVEIVSFDDIEVEFNTDLSEVENNLPEEIELKINQSVKTRTLNSEVVEISWSSETYNQTEPGTYEFVGVYELPDTIEAEKPEVTVQVTVLADKTNMSELEAAIKYAEEVNEDPDATVEEVEEAINYLDEKLKPFKVENDFSALEAAIKNAKNFDLTNKTDDSVDALKQSIDAAETVLGNDTSTQIEIDQAIKDLQAAIEGLTEISVDFTKLKEVIEAGNNINRTNKTPDSIAKLDNALEEAETILTNSSVTQAKVDKAIKVLKKAINGLIIIEEDDSSEGSSPGDSEDDSSEGSSPGDSEDDSSEGSSPGDSEDDSSEGSSPGDSEDDTTEGSSPDDSEDDTTGSIVSNDSESNSDEKNVSSNKKELMEKDKKLPNSATNIFNYFVLGLIMIVLGLYLARRKKVK